MSGYTSAGKLPSKLLAGNSFISLAGREDQIKFSQKSLKMPEMASKSFIHALMLFLGGLEREGEGN